MSNETPSSLIEIPEELPASHAGHAYTRHCVASLRRQAQKLPTLSGVADHLQALAGEVEGWENRARALHGMGLSLFARCQELESSAAAQSIMVEGMIEDFAGQRQTLEEEVSSLASTVSALSAQVGELNGALATSRSQLHDAEQSRQQLLAEHVSFQMFHDNLVKDLDGSEARSMARVRFLEDELVAADLAARTLFESREEDVVLASSIIADLLGRLEQTSVTLATVSRQLDGRTQETVDLRARLTEREVIYETSLVEKNQHIERVTHANAQIQEHLTAAENAVAELNQKLGEAQREAQVAQSQLVQEACVLRDALERTSSKVASLEQDLSKERDQQAASWQEAVQWRNDHANLLVRLSTLAGQLDQEAELRLAAEKAAARLPELEEALSGAWQELQVAQVSNEELLGSNKELKAQTEELRSHQQDLAEHVERLEQERRALDERAQELLNENQTLTDRSEELRIRSEQLEGQNFRLIDENQALSSRTELFAGKTQELREENDGLRKDLVSAQETLLDLREQAQQQVARLEGDLSAAQELIEEESSRAAILAEDSSRKIQELTSRVESLLAAEAELLEDRAALAVSRQEVDRLGAALSEAMSKVDTLGKQAERAAELDVQVSALHELLRAQGAELERADIERRTQALLIAGHDDSLPWTLRAWTEDERPSFIPVAGVKEWLDRNGWTVADLGPARFPGYSAADREHLAMAAGVRVDQFLALPFVREFVKDQVRKLLEQGTRPSSVDCEWLMVEGSPRWRTNRLWRHMIAVSEAQAPQAWEGFLKGELMGV